MTTKTFLTTTALSLLLATTAVAQTGTGTTAPTDGTAPMATETETMAPQSLSEMTVADLNGTDVMDANGDVIGNITDVIQGPGEGEVVIGIGGFLGIGQYDVAMGLSDLSFNAEEQAITVSMTREELEALPEYDATDMESLPPETQVSTLMVDDSGTPATDAPATDAPASGTPDTNSPATSPEAPAADATETEAPDAGTPDTNSPATDTPGTDAPATEAPTSDTTDDTDGAPATNSPATDMPESDTEEEDSTTND